MTAIYNVDFINPFLTAVVEVLGTMANVQATPGSPYINRQRTSACDITGLIGITGHSSGAMSLSLDEPAILQIVNNMLYESYEELNEEIADAVGELTNMIAGKARGELAKQGMNFKASTPSVVLGKGHQVSHITGAPILAIPFTTTEGHLVVEVSFAQCTEMDQSLECQGVGYGPEGDAKAAPAQAAPKPASSKPLSKPKPPVKVGDEDKTWHAQLWKAPEKKDKKGKK